jgi:hypothetical protein
MKYRNVKQVLLGGYTSGMETVKGEGQGDGPNRGTLLASMEMQHWTSYAADICY